MFINKETLKLEYKIQADEIGLKVIDVMATKMQMSSRLIRKCKSHKQILLNGQKSSVNALVNHNDIITVMLDHDENTFDPNPIEVDVIYEDADMLVVNKPPFLVVHPTKGHPEGTLANALSYYEFKKGEDYKIRFINRLDRDTTGNVLIAKNAYAQQVISDQMVANEVDKEYYAIVSGKMENQSGTINAPIERANEGDILRIVREDGQICITHYEVVDTNEQYTLVKLMLETGRTHQIRVHLAHIGHPILGDHLYGIEHEAINRQALHCYMMRFRSPRNDEKSEIVAPLPDDFKHCLNKCNLSWN